MVVFNPTVYTVQEDGMGGNINIELLTSTERQLPIVINITDGTALKCQNGGSLMCK